jgi:hypothetical protein
MSENNEKSEISAQDPQKSDKSVIKRGRKPKIIIEESTENNAINNDSDLHDRIKRLETLIIKLASIMGMKHLTKDIGGE